MLRPFIAIFASPVDRECLHLEYDYAKDVSVVGDNQPVISADLRCAELLTKTEIQREDDDDDAPVFLTKTKVDREDDDD